MDNTNAVSVTLTALLLVSLSFGPSMAISIFHWCLVRSWPFAGSQRFLDDLFTCFYRQPVGDQLRASGRKWFTTTPPQKEKKSEFTALPFHGFCDVILSCEMWLVLHANEWEGNAAGNWETDVGSELLLTLFSVTYPGPVAVRGDMFYTKSTRSCVERGNSDRSS